MLASYQDIKSRIKEEPLWYDENGTPRYDKFTPDLVPDIYSEEAVLMKIKCQDCGSEFMVGMNWSRMSQIWNPHSAPFTERVKAYLKDKKGCWFPLHYGDPPIHGCVGDTMNCEDIQIVEFWRKEKFEWVRKSEFEITAEEEK